MFSVEKEEEQDAQLHSLSSHSVFFPVSDDFLRRQDGVIKDENLVFFLNNEHDKTVSD